MLFDCWTQANSEVLWSLKTICSNFWHPELICSNFLEVWTFELCSNKGWTNACLGSERNGESRDPGLDTLITNLIATEVEIGEALVVLHCIGQCLRCAKCGNLKEMENRATRASTPLSPILLPPRWRLVRLLLCFIASANACDVQNVEIWKKLRIERPGPRHPYHQSHFHRGGEWWGSGCAARRRPQPAMCKMWKSERNWALQDPGLDPLITNLILPEVEIGEGGVVLQGVGHSLRCAKCENLKEIENLQDPGLDTLITNLIVQEVKIGEALIVLQGIGESLRCAKCGNLKEMENPGLDTLITNLIATEVEIGEALVVLHCIGQCLRCAKCGNLKEIENLQDPGLDTAVTNLIVTEIEESEGGVHLQHLSQCLRKKAIWQSKCKERRLQFDSVRGGSRWRLCWSSRLPPRPPPPPPTALPRTRLKPRRRNNGPRPRRLRRPNRRTEGRARWVGCFASARRRAPASRSQGAEEGRSLVGNFLEKGISLVIFGDGFMEKEYELNWNLYWINHCEYKNDNIMMKFISSQANHHCTMWDSKYLNLAAIDIHWHTCMLLSIPVNSWKPVLNACISWEHICEVFWLVLLFFSLCGLKHTKKTQVGLCYLGTSPYRSTCSFPNSSCNIFTPEIFWFHWIGIYL